MELVISVLGPFQASYAGRPLTFASSAARALLVYLAIESGQAHSRERLAALLWPDQPQTAAYANLRQALARLRKALPEPAAQLLLVSPQALQLPPDRARVDLAHFDELLIRCASHAHADPISCPACRERQSQAAALYRGELLHGLGLDLSHPFGEWLLVRREALHQRALGLFHSLAESYEASGDYPTMRAYAARQIELEPWHEQAYRQLMRALALAGDRDSALAQFQRCRQILASELGLAPDAETRALAERIRAGQLTPATRSAAAPRHNLPAALTPFIGRESELAALAALCGQPGARLITLVGMGGVGKTSLALELARASLGTFADGVFFVPLAPLADPATIAPAIAQALELSMQAGDVATALLRFLRDKHVLLILDNLEHLLAEPGRAAELVIGLLEAAPHVQIIATSRERLNLRAEQLVAVEGLAYDSAAASGDAAELPSVQVFAQSARRVRLGFQLDAASLPEVQRICQLVQGVPLALELAAAWAELLPLDQIAGEIVRSASFLAAKWHDAPERQRSMRAVFGWSWRLLSANERQLFRRLAVFRGGFTRASAETVVGASLAGLIGLVQKSLLRPTEREGAGTRYELHELLRQLAEEQLDESAGERAAIEQQHSQHYLALVAERERRMARDDPRAAVAEIQAELGNVRQAWAWATRQQRFDLIDASANGMSYFYLHVGPYAEAEQVFGQAAYILTRSDQLAGDGSAAERGWQLASKLLILQAGYAVTQNKLEQGLAIALEGLALAQASGNRDGEAIGRMVQAETHYRRSEYAEARVLCEQILQQIREHPLGSPRGEPHLDTEWRALRWLGLMAATLDDYRTAEIYLGQGLQLCRSLGKLRGEGILLFEMGRAAQSQGSYAAAAEHYRQALSLTPRVGYRGLESIVQFQLGDVLRLLGQYAQALAMMQQALASFRELGERMDEATALAYLGHLADCLGDDSRARSWLDAALQVSREQGAREPELDALVYLARYSLRLGAGEQSLGYAEEAARAAALLGGSSQRARASVLLGHAHASLGQYMLAQAAYRQAQATYEQQGKHALAAEPRAGMAVLALAQGDIAEARAQALQLLSILAVHPRAGLDEPYAIYLTCFQVLEAAGDPRAHGILQAGQQLLLTDAGQIADPGLRSLFLEHVPAHCALLAARVAPGNRPVR